VFGKILTGNRPVVHAGSSFPSESSVKSVVEALVFPVNAQLLWLSATSHRFRARVPGMSGLEWNLALPHSTIQMDTTPHIVSYRERTTGQQKKSPVT
jgi:hypothetical protein